MEVDSSLGSIWVCSSVREKATRETHRSRLIAGDHGVQRPTERGRERVCVGGWVGSTIWDQMHKPVTRETECLRLATVCVSLHLCVQREDLGTHTSLGSCVPRSQKLESLGSRGSYCTDRVSEPHCWRTHLADVYLFPLMHLHPHQPQWGREWGHMCWDLFSAECFSLFWPV